MKILFFIILFFTIFASYSQLKEQQSNNTKMVLLPIINVPDFITKNKDFKISLISGLNYYDVKWHHNDTIIKTPENLILNFDKEGEYIPYVFGKELKAYTIWIY